MFSYAYRKFNLSLIKALFRTRPTKDWKEQLIIDEF
jgi:hypothetical protein